MTSSSVTIALPLTSKATAGPRDFVPHVNLAVDDIISYFDSIKDAICLLIHFRDPLGYQGAVLAHVQDLGQGETRLADPSSPLAGRESHAHSAHLTADIMTKSVLRVTDHLNRRLSDVKIPVHHAANGR
ncbi:hypothetical protein NL676_008162 [Syzygium grande]|nr:hypothetical protein NL676_008162 [Syzygium grande]